MNSYWLNLPVEDVDRTIDFFKGIGLELHGRSNDGRDSAGFKVGSMTLMFFQTKVLEAMLNQEVNTGKSPHECIVSFDMTTNEEVDKLALDVEAHGGKVLNGPSTISGYYGLVFQDPDGHLYNVIVM